jgi:hypothetical protein
MMRDMIVMINGRLHRGLVIDYEDLIHKCLTSYLIGHYFVRRAFLVGRLVMINASTKVHKNRVVMELRV